jgi:hypothetical protein
MFELASEKFADVPVPKLIHELEVPGKFTAVVIPVNPAVAVVTVAALLRYFWIKFVVVVSGTDPVTYCVTSRDPAGMRLARM